MSKINMSYFIGEEKKLETSNKEELNNITWLLLIGRKEPGNSAIDFKHVLAFESPLACFRCSCSCSSLPPPLSFQLFSLFSLSTHVSFHWLSLFVPVFY
jgi:hypothetical protein